MKYKNYLLAPIAGFVSIMSVNAKDLVLQNEEIDIDKLTFIEEELDYDLGFDTTQYLPENFDPYRISASLEAIHFMEEDHVELGFNTSTYLPEGFNPYIQ